jgi:hypothetical protein
MRKWNVKFNWIYGTFVPVLIGVVGITTGDVLEMGAGIYSTPLLHWMCSPCQRNLYTYDHNEKYLDMYQLRDFEDFYHTITCVSDWDDARIERDWSVAFVDHAPAKRRRVDIERLKDHAQYVVVHDSDECKRYGYEPVFALYRYRRDFRVAKRGTTVLSDFNDLKGLTKC